MPRIRLTVVASRCRSGHHQPGDTFIVEDLCPPLCHELWYQAYPYVFALMNGADLDHGESRARVFEVCCPDEGRVCLRGEVLEG